MPCQPTALAPVPVPAPQLEPALASGPEPAPSPVTARRWIFSRAVLLPLAFCALLTACGGGGSGDDGGGGETGSGGGPTEPALQAAWAVAAQNYNERSAVQASPPPAFIADQTLRQVMRVTADGSSVRVQVSNLYGNAPLVVGAVHIARSAGGSTIEAGSSLALRFAGQAGLTVPPGRAVWSDTAPYTVTAQERLAVTLYLPASTQVATVHSYGRETGYLADGNVTTRTSLDVVGTTPSYLWVTGIDVHNDAARGSIVAFGDSITDGYAATVGADARYPDALARRVAAEPALAGYSVINAGISGNRVLNEGVGRKGIERLARDVLGSSGVTHTIILLGINDIGYSASVPAQAVTAVQVMAGLRRLVDQAQAAGVEVFLGTLTPFKGAGYYSADAEAARQAVNLWIRANSAGADGVIDFDAALRDPGDAQRLRPAYDSGDRIHPNDAGHQAMADAVNLALFR
jgi:lysophospholipase L1-like esterase